MNDWDAYHITKTSEILVGELFNALNVGKPSLESSCANAPCAGCACASSAINASMSIGACRGLSNVCVDHTDGLGSGNEIGDSSFFLPKPNIINYPKNERLRSVKYTIITASLKFGDFVPSGFLSTNTLPPLIE
jgi:hypothetical protein